MDSVKQILDHMRTNRIQITPQALNALIVSYIKEKYAVSNLCYTSRRINCYTRIIWRNEKEAESVLEMMRVSPQPPNESTFLAMLHAYSAVPGGDVPRALERVRHVLHGAGELGLSLPPMRVLGALLPYCIAGYEPQSIHVCRLKKTFWLHTIIVMTSGKVDSSFKFKYT